MKGRISGDGLFILEHLKFDQLQHSEPHIEGLVDCDLHLPEIASK